LGSVLGVRQQEGQVRWFVSLLKMVHQVMVLHLSMKDLPGEFVEAVRHQLMVLLYSCLLHSGVQDLLYWCMRGFLLVFSQGTGPRQSRKTKTDCHPDVPVSLLWHR